MERALGAAGAQLLSARSLEGGRLLAVRYRFLEGRFESVVEVPSLRVVDAGICLEGADRRLTPRGRSGVSPREVCFLTDARWRRWTSPWGGR